MSTELQMAVISAGAKVGDYMKSFEFEFYGKGGYFRITKPGRCSEATHRTLEKLIDAVRNPKRCTAVPGNIKNPAMRHRLQLVNLNRMHQWSRLAIARHTLNATCYSGMGDHGTPTNDALGRMYDCLSIIWYNNKTGKPR